jgi:hypothetical protein
MRNKQVTAEKIQNDRVLRQQTRDASQLTAA